MQKYNLRPDCLRMGGDVEGVRLLWYEGVLRAVGWKNMETKEQRESVAPSKNLYLGVYRTYSGSSRD